MKKHSRRPRENGLTCSIRHMTLPENSAAPIDYTALSYTWGDGKDVASLKLRDESSGESGEITVTSDLISALQTILEAGKRCLLWIDQISINQSSTNENEQQLQLMRWIYARAVSVRIWLGPAADDSDEAVRYLENHDGPSVLRNMSDPSQGSFSPRLKIALERLFRQPYWTRTWTVQEATALDILEDVKVSCGHIFVSLLRMFHWIRTAQLNPNEYTHRILVLQGQGPYAMHNFWSIRKRHTQNLSILTELVRHMKASDPRDKIYSMLNFATDVHGSGIRPDYTKTVRQAYTELVLWPIRKYRCLDILGNRLPPLKDDAPSWVPEWSGADLAYSIIKTSNGFDLGSSPLYRACGK